MTNELPLVHRALAAAHVPIHTLKRVTAFDGEAVTIADVYSGAETRLACRSLVIVGVRAPRDELYRTLIAKGADLENAGIAAVTRIGDALAPGAIVHAVHSGHRYAREFDAVPRGRTLYTGLPGMNAAQLERTLPSSWYRSAEVFGVEKERIFCREWIAACREEELPNPGDYRCWTCSARASCWCAIAKAGCGRSTMSAGIVARVCAAPRKKPRPARRPSRRNHRRAHDRMPLPPVVLRLQRRAGRRAALERRRPDSKRRTTICIRSASTAGADSSS